MLVLRLVAGVVSGEGMELFAGSQAAGADGARFSPSGAAVVYRQVFNTVFLAVAVAGCVCVIWGVVCAAAAVCRLRGRAKTE